MCEVSDKPQTGIRRKEDILKRLDFSKRPMCVEYHTSPLAAATYETATSEGIVPGHDTARTQVGGRAGPNKNVWEHQVVFTCNWSKRKKNPDKQPCLSNGYDPMEKLKLLLGVLKTISRLRRGTVNFIVTCGWTVCLGAGAAPLVGSP